MIFAGVRLPDQIRIAFEEDKLVIFAGAGVSLPAPSNLPSFNGLVRQICGQPSVQSAKEDQVLGKLARNGTDVHAAAAKILYHSKTHPTELHKQALRFLVRQKRCGSSRQILMIIFLRRREVSFESMQLRNSTLRLCRKAIAFGELFIFTAQQEKIHKQWC
jgi:hypothetical protein